MGNFHHTRGNRSIGRTSEKAMRFSRTVPILFTSFLLFVAGNGYAQESKKQPDKVEITKATYMVTGLH